jgi:broad specificity phosphatase PhoE
VITLYYRAVVRLAMGTTALGIEAWRWPAGLRDQVIARVLGRALAHEVGHFVLRSPHHSSSGLMRAQQRAAALANSDRKAFALTELDRARLRIVLSTPPWTLVRAPAAGTIP